MTHMGRYSDKNRNNTVNQALSYFMVFELPSRYRECDFQEF